MSPSIPKPGDIPPATFRNFVTEYAAVALVCLGYVNSPVNHKKALDLPRARHLIDILALIREKTRGNLAPHEEEYLITVIEDLEHKYGAAESGAKPGASDVE